MFHRLHAGIHMGSLKCFFMSRLGQSPDLFPYLLNCLHNPPLVLEVSWRCWYCKGVVNDLSKNKLHPTSPRFSSALSQEKISFSFAVTRRQSHGSSAVPQCSEGRGLWFSVLSRHRVSPAPCPSSSSAPALTSPPHQYECTSNHNIRNTVNPLKIIPEKYQLHLSIS